MGEGVGGGNGEGQVGRAEDDYDEGEPVRRDTDAMSVISLMTAYPRVQWDGG